jgi:hypothetical protein
MEYVEYLPGAIAAVAMTVRIVAFFTVEQRVRKSTANAA